MFVYAEKPFTSMKLNLMQSCNENGPFLIFSPQTPPLSEKGDWCLEGGNGYYSITFSFHSLTLCYSVRSASGSLCPEESHIRTPFPMQLHHPGIKGGKWEIPFHVQNASRFTEESPE